MTRFFTRRRGRWLAVPLAVALGAALAAGMERLPRPAAAQTAEEAGFTLSVQQLRINQRISQAAVRRSNSALDRLDRLGGGGQTAGPAGPPGPAGPQGPQGPEGPRGPSEARHTAEANGPDDIAQTPASTEVVSVDLPPGSYVVLGKVVAHNEGPDETAVRCTLFPGLADSYPVSLPAGGTKALPLQGVHTVTSPLGSQSVLCRRGGGDATVNITEAPRLTAIRVADIPET